MHQIQWDRFLSSYFGFSLSVSFYQRSTLIFIHTLLLPGQMGEDKDPSKKQRDFGNLGEMHIKVLSLKQFSKQRRMN